MNTKAVRMMLGPALAAILILSACSSGGGRLAERSYPEGFSLRQPADWKAEVVDKSTIVVSSPDQAPEPAFLFVYPFFLRQTEPADAWLERNLPRLKTFFAGASIETKRRLRDRPDEWAVKIGFQKGGAAFTGLALCSIFERSGILYVAAGKADSFEKNRETLLAMLQSFRFGAPEAGAGPAAPRIAYEKFSDPSEQAFTLDVPQGWQTQGGTNRRAAVDVVHSVRSVSPDGEIVIQFNDPNIPAFALPNPTLAFSGFPEGSWYSPGYGVRNLVKRYLPGGQFLAEYLTQSYRQGVDGFAFVSRADRPDIVADFNRIYAGLQSYGVQFSQHAGEAAFRFSRGGEPYVGYGLALTQIVYMPAMQGGNWNVAMLLLSTCPESRAAFAQGIFQHMFESIQWNPQWLASQQQLTANVSQIVSQTSQEISKIISDSYWTRQGVMDDVSRRFSNSILGVTDVTDPETGETWKVEAGHNFYWAKPGANVVAGTETFTRPDIDFRPLKELK
jgi:hypothetical protein